VEADAAEEAWRRTQSVVGEADPARQSAVSEVMAVSEAMAVQMWRRVVEERARGWWENNSS
jgi:hypothetical protein